MSIFEEGRYFTEVMSLAQEVNGIHRKRFKDVVAYFGSDLDYSLEFKTIALDIGRRSGKTEWISHLPESAVVFVGNISMRSRLKERGCRAKVFVMSKVEASDFEVLRGIDTDYIVFDEPYMFSPKSVLRVYESLVRSSDTQTFYLIGGSLTWSELRK